MSTNDDRYNLAEPEPLANEEVARMVAWLREIAQLWEPDAPRAKQLFRAAELLERLASQPVPEGPTDEELDELFTEIDQGGEALSWRAYARAVLARWGGGRL